MSCHAPTSRSACGKGIGFKSTASITAKIVIVVPSPATNVMIAVRVNAGARPNDRSA
jgi:hypothetical protein